MGMDGLGKSCESSSVPTQIPPTWDKVVFVDVLLVVWRQRQFKITRSCQLDTRWQDTWRCGAQPLALALVSLG